MHSVGTVQVNIHNASRPCYLYLGDHAYVQVINYVQSASRPVLCIWGTMLMYKFIYKVCLDHVVCIWGTMLMYKFIYKVRLDLLSVFGGPCLCTS
jgi:hypothetical protein